jgi:tetratricopeptide (TPR) repeat protein
MTRNPTKPRPAGGRRAGCPAPSRGGGRIARVGCPAPPEPRANYSRWRAGTLTLVYLLVAAHVAHWKLTGKTLAPLELNEVMYTLELGIVTAGFIFMTVAALSVAIFGRFFCSWGCHILALEDLCAWLLKKVGIRPKPIRSRVLLFVPPAAMFYMFFWPQLSRIIAGRPLSNLHVLSDGEGWASYMTTNFWRNLPGPWIIVITFAICGFAIVYFLGSRGFCTYACPYGAAFALIDRLAPGRIKLKGHCVQCATCTSVCQSHVRVHEELAAFGKVVNPACMKDLDCVAACPQGVLGYGFTQPAILRSRSTPRPRVKYDFTWAEDFLMLIVFLATLLIFRGLYGTVPFLMTLALGGILAYLSVLCLRIATRNDVRLNNYQLKRTGQLTGQGKVFAASSLLLGLFVFHSALIRYHEACGERALNECRALAREKPAAALAEVAAAGIEHLKSCERWGLFTSPLLNRGLAELYQVSDRPGDAEPYLRRVIAESPNELPMRLALGRLYARLGRMEQALPWLTEIASAREPSEAMAAQFAHLRCDANELLGEVYFQRGDFVRAKGAYESALADQPRSAAANQGLGELLAGEGRLRQAAEQFRAAIASRPDLAPAHYNLAVMLAAQGRQAEAIKEYREALSLEPADPQAHNNLGYLLGAGGRIEEAAEHFREAIRIDPRFSHAHFNLGRTLHAQGRSEEAATHFRTAARLDRQYAELLGMHPAPADPAPGEHTVTAPAPAKPGR